MKFGIEIAFYLIRETLLFLSYILFCVTAIITAVIFSLIGIIWVFNVNYLFMDLFEATASECFSIIFELSKPSTIALNPFSVLWERL